MTQDELQRIELAKQALVAAYQKQSVGFVLRETIGVTVELREGRAAVADAEAHWLKLVQELRSKIDQI